MNNAEVLIKFKGDTTDVDKKTSSLGTNIKSGLKTAAYAATAAAATAVGAISTITRASVDAFAEYEQLEGGLESVFDAGSAEMNKILETSKTAYKDLTMSQNDYLKSFESAYPIINNGLSENADALEYTNKVLQLESDLFNTYGGSTEQYATAINWALKGTFSYVDNLNLGIKGTAEGFVEAANASGVLGREVKNVNELTSDEIVDVIEAYAKQYGVLGKTADEAGTTIQGSLNMMKSSFTDLLSNIAQGTDISEPLNNLLTSAMTFGQNLMPVIETAINTIIDMLPQLVEIVATQLPQLIINLLPKLIEGTVAIINGLIEALPEMITMIADILPDLIPVIIDAVLQLIPMLIDHLPEFIEAGFKLLVGLVEGILKSWPKAVEATIKTGKSILESFKKILSPEYLMEIGGNMLKGLWEGISNIKDWILNKITGIGSSILGAVKGIFGIHSPSKEFAIIGEYNMLGLEKGMEDMQPEIQKDINGMFDLSPSMMGSMNNVLSPNISVVNDINIEQDPLGQMVRNIKTFSGGTKNDYNYGVGV